MNRVYFKRKTEFKSWRERGCLACRDQRELEMAGSGSRGWGRGCSPRRSISGLRPQLPASPSSAHVVTLPMHPGLPARKKGAGISGFYDVMGLNEWFLTPNFQLQFRHGFSNRIEGN